MNRFAIGAALPVLRLSSFVRDDLRTQSRYPQEMLFSQLRYSCDLGILTNRPEDLLPVQAVAEVVLTFRMQLDLTSNQRSLRKNPAVFPYGAKLRLLLFLMWR
jgi:hypothetical protein